MLPFTDVPTNFGVGCASVATAREVRRRAARTMTYLEDAIDAAQETDYV